MPTPVFKDFLSSLTQKRENKSNIYWNQNIKAVAPQIWS